MRLSSSTQRKWFAGAVALTAVLVASAVCTAANAAAMPAPPINLKTWQVQLAQVPQPAGGCFTAAYPRLKWQATGCTATPSYPMPPKRGARPLVIGNGDDVSAQVPGGTFISTGIGSFDNVTNVTSESGLIGNSGTPVPDAYTLQLNTNFFASTACAGSPNAGCQGWEQFVYLNNGTSGAAFIQYWLLQYNTTCPGGWNQFQFTGDPDIYCFRNNSLGAAPVPNQPITNLANLSLSGTATAGGDSVTMFVGGTAFTRTGDNSVNAAAGWNIAEFNVFGAGGSSAGGGEATFNSGAALTARTRVIYGGTAAPTCVSQGFTGETNNLNFATPAPMPTQPGPAVIFNESTTGTAMSNCLAATTVGDTHLHTFAGLFYDFQATGDFTLAQIDPNFEVQARQISGAPTWPDAAVNQAVGARLGSDKVALCGGGDQLVVNGEGTDVADGTALALPGGGTVTRVGGTYVFSDQNGNNVRVVPHPGYLDATVGAGTWPTRVHGLLGNPDNSPRLLEARDGTVFQVPLSFEDMYNRFGHSWRVDAADSVLSDCGRAKEVGNPRKPFFVDNLSPDVRERAQSICRQAGVENDTLVDACTLDVAVIGPRAADAYVGAAKPVVDGNR
jgi:hypothetical protein